MNDRVHIVAYHSVEIGDNVLIASNVLISDTNHGSYAGPHQDGPGVAPNDRSLSYAPVKIGDRVWIGEGVSILPGVTIGDGAVVGAGSVVTRDLPSNSVNVGIPCRTVRFWNPDEEEWSHGSGE